MMPELIFRDNVPEVNLSIVRKGTTKIQEFGADAKKIVLLLGMLVLIAAFEG